jgi:hypothetical protein
MSKGKPAGQAVSMEAVETGGVGDQGSQRLEANGTLVMGWGFNTTGGDRGCRDGWGWE